MEKTKLQEKLTGIQQKLKVPKNNKNSFGNYNYRSCEDILEAVKPLLLDCTLVISDEIVNMGNRYYVKAIVTLSSGNDTVIATAYAREPETKKGMDEAQITGSASSYARKYALNGLFAIDDTKDADSMDNTVSTPYKDEDNIVHEPVNNGYTKPAVQQRVQQTTGDPTFCTIHNKQMKERTSTQGGTWYDHRWKVGDAWNQCNGRPKAQKEEEPPFTDY